MHKSKTIQIPESLFMQLVRYHWLDDRTPELEEAIRDGLSSKIDKMAARDAYARTHSVDQQTDA